MNGRESIVQGSLEGIRSRSTVRQANTFGICKRRGGGKGEGEKGALNPRYYLLSKDWIMRCGISGVSIRYEILGLSVNRYEHSTSGTLLS